MAIKKQQGVSLYITILILTLLIGSVLTLSAILTDQMRVIFHLGDSVVAFYAADASIEQALYNIRRLKISGDTGFPIHFANGSVGNVFITSSPTQTIIKAVGTYKNSERAIEVRY